MDISLSGGQSGSRVAIAQGSQQDSPSSWSSRTGHGCFVKHRGSNKRQDQIRRAPLVTVKVMAIGNYVSGLVTQRKVLLSFASEERSLFGECVFCAGSDFFDNTCPYRIGLRGIMSSTGDLRFEGGAFLQPV